MNLTALACTLGDKPALIMADSGESLSYGELEGRSNQIAHLFRRCGLRPGNHVAVLMENCLDYFPIVWAAQRAGLFYTPVNWHLGDDEAAYIVDNCTAQFLVHSASLDGAAIAESVGGVKYRYVVGETTGSSERLADALSGLPSTPIDGESEGYYMFYSSGTTGRPKGILPTRDPQAFGTGLPIDHRMHTHFGFGSETVFLSTGPLYHAAPLAWAMGTIRNGGTAIVTRRFDAESTLRVIETHRVTHAMFVPTMFVRMLKLDPATRLGVDVSSLELVIHSAAPCPDSVKRAMIDWFGPKITEFYGASEGTGFFMIDSPEWLAHPGSVGRPLVGAVHICDDDGRELPTGETGTVWFDGVRRFEYHRDAQRTAEAFDHRGWTTLGDLGHVDDQGYLYLSSRRTDLIISGGVNIYPTEVEDVLLEHPAIVDVAVIGLPDPDMGQVVHAVVTPLAAKAVDVGLETDILAFCQSRLARFKCPRTLRFGEVPRLPSGKIVRRQLMATATEA
ncbi:AMP-binding protein [Gordonia insulae]|uniref:Bile acid-coenzyme A ligase n=1 Tax=Gordonia insulae TaxID=2420509 RepID=A0A3G8JMP6_9ACTN|nr:AMP-binding protein [Gordonia insulae]AZG45875.1 Bile acid-coenzyme A ligase [Gordonia insulae]